MENKKFMKFKLIKINNLIFIFLSKNFLYYLKKHNYFR